MSNVKKKEANPTAPVVVRFPLAVVKKLDKQAAQNGRSRSSEVRQMVLASMQRGAQA